MQRPLIGPKIRERRVALGITQSSLAHTLGISASYLNLIESNKRNIAGALLKRIADTLSLSIEALDGAAERRLLDDLEELSAEPMLAELAIDPASSRELASRHAGWARALIQVHRAWRDRDQTVNALADRLSHDPRLADAVHSVLTRAAAIRSSVEILDSVDDLGPTQRRRFVSIIADESRRLTDVAQALAAFFEKANTDPRSIMPVEEVDDFLFDRNNYFPALEALADDFRAAAGINGECRESTLVDYLQHAHSVTVVTSRAADPQSASLSQPVVYDAASRMLQIAERVPAATRRFEMARLGIELWSGGEPVTGEMQTSSLLSSDAARRRARHVLSSYAAGAVILPYIAFAQAARASRYDVDLLVERFQASFEQVCHRLVTLKRPGAEGVPFGLVRIDAAGYVTKRFPLPHLPVPRYGNACPMWALYGAFQTPGAMVRQLAEFPAGDRFLFLARTVEKAPAAFPMPRRLMSIMLACDALHAQDTVYGAGLDLSSAAPAVPVGGNCRLCVRRECRYREEDPIIDA